VALAKNGNRAKLKSRKSESLKAIKLVSLGTFSAVSKRHQRAAEGGKKKSFKDEKLQVYFEERQREASEMTMSPT
jgi:hypothetical protein